MPIKSLKQKLSDIASGEILGETLEERRRKAEEKREKDAAQKEIADAKPKREKKVREPKPPKPPKEKKVKEPKPPKEKKVRTPRQPKPVERKVSKESIFKRKEPIIEELEEIVEIVEAPIEESEENEVVVSPEIEAGYKDVLSILNIKENLKVEVDFQSSDLDYIEFTPTTPVGFDFDEVTDFISRVKYALNRYEAAIKQRNKDLILVASEVKRVERKMVEENEDRELSKIINDNMTEEEALIQENFELKIEIQDLQGKLLNGKNESLEIRKLKEEIEVLRAENELLMNTMIDDSKTTSSLPISKNKDSLPSFDLDDDFENLTIKSEGKLPLISEDLPPMGSTQEKTNVFKTADIKMPEFVEDDEDILNELINDDDDFDKMMKNL